MKQFSKIPYALAWKSLQNISLWFYNNKMPEKRNLSIKKGLKHFAKKLGVQRVK